MSYQRPCAFAPCHASMYIGSFAWLNLRKTPYYSRNRSFAFSVIVACVSIINALETRQSESFILTILCLSPARRQYLLVSVQTSHTDCNATVISSTALNGLLIDYQFVDQPSATPRVCFMYMYCILLFNSDGHKRIIMLQ